MVNHKSNASKSSHRQYAGAWVSAVSGGRGADVSSTSARNDCGNGVGGIAI